MTDAITYITPEEIQVAYQRLYTVLRTYIWDFEVVQAIAELEVSLYQRFPNKEDMQSKFNLLDSKIKDTYNALTSSDLPEFEDAMTSLRDYISDYSDVGFELYSVTELPDDAEGTKGEPTDSVKPDKEKFSIGSIIKEDDVLEEM